MESPPPMSTADLSVARATDTLKRGLDKTTGRLVVIEGREIEGAWGTVIGPLWGSDMLVMMDFIMFVRPQYRRSTHAKRLMQAAKTASIQLGMPLIMGHGCPADSERKRALYQRQFGPSVGAFFVFDPTAEGAV